MYFYDNGHGVLEENDIFNHLYSGVQIRFVLFLFHVLYSKTKTVVGKDKFLSKPSGLECCFLITQSFHCPCFRSVDSMIPLLSICEISIFYPASLTVQMGLCRT